MNRIHLASVLPTLSEPWKPITVAKFNGNEVMVAKGRGSYPWHQHETTDDFFLVLTGCLTIEMRDRSVRLGPGELFVVPRGVEHRPVAKEDTHFMLIEPAGTGNGGTTLV